MILRGFNRIWEWELLREGMNECFALTLIKIAASEDIESRKCRNR